MNHFDNAARSWDSNPVHFERSEAVAASIIKNIHLSKSMNAMEYGAGTGILSFLLHDKLESIILLDNSSEMIQVMHEKIAKSGATNLKPMLFDLENNEFQKQKFDLIFNQMVMHHVNDIEGLILKFRQMLKPGGFLAIADLYSEDGSFHGEWFKGHKGFDPDDLAGKLRLAGFTGIDHSLCFSIKKQTDSGAVKEFPIFLLTANI